MSLFFIFATESQLRQGLPWAKRFALQSQMPVTLMILGGERKTLLEHASSLTKDDDQIASVLACDAETTPIIETLRNDKAKIVLAMQGESDTKLVWEIMAKCPTPMVALRRNGDPPESASHVIALDAKTCEKLKTVSANLVGFAPDLELLDDRDTSKSEAHTTWIDAFIAAERQRCEKGDLLWIDADTLGSRGSDWIEQVLSQSTHASVAVYDSGHPLVETTAARIRYWATHVAEPMGRDQRKELANSLEEGSRPNLEFLGLISASAMLAAFGLLQDSAAVIIGAMLIAPLMTPILGAGMALTHGNRPLFQSACLTITLGFVGALFSSYLFGLLYLVTHLDDNIRATGEMLARSHPTVLDFCVGLVGGMAASYARTRSHLSSALAGAAIAAALVPPISTAGLQIAFGQWESTDQSWPVFGPLLLVTINVFTIMIGSSFVLYARGMRISKATNVNDKWPLRMAALIVTLLLLVAVSL